VERRARENRIGRITRLSRSEHGTNDRGVSATTEADRSAATGGGRRFGGVGVSSSTMVDAASCRRFGSGGGGVGGRCGFRVLGGGGAGRCGCGGANRCDGRRGGGRREVAAARWRAANFNYFRYIQICKQCHIYIFGEKCHIYITREWNRLQKQPKIEPIGQPKHRIHRGQELVSLGCPAEMNN
jgi:hypothetical protein